MTENEIINTTKQKGETARLAHKNTIDRCKSAIDQGFYFEAIFILYNIFESRVNKIFKILNMPCGIDDDYSMKVGIGRKLFCLSEFINNDRDIFGNTKFASPSQPKKIRKWCERRNTRTHALLQDTDKYEHLIVDTKKLAIDGYEYALILYKETNRLKYLQKKKPELFQNHKCECCPKDKSCISFIESLKKEIG